MIFFQGEKQWITKGLQAVQDYFALMERNRGQFLMNFDHVPRVHQSFDVAEPSAQR